MWQGVEAQGTFFLSLKNIFRLSFVFYMCACFAFVHVYMPHVCEVPEAIRSPENAILDDGEPPPVGAGNQAQVLCKSNKYS